MLELLNELQGKLNDVETALMFARATWQPDVSDLLVQLEALQEVANRIREESNNLAMPTPFIFIKNDGDELEAGVPA